jgi:hypothetical protein
MQSSILREPVGETGMKFIVVGIGGDGSTLTYPKETLGDAGYTAAKMADNGVDAVRILDAEGKEYSLKEGWDAFRLSKPKGWKFY